MSINEFFKEFMHEIDETQRQELQDGNSISAQTIFLQIMGKYMVEEGIAINDIEQDSFAAKVGNTSIKLDGFAIDQEVGRLDLFSCLFDESMTEQSQEIDKRRIISSLNETWNFLKKSSDGALLNKIDSSRPIAAVAKLLSQKALGISQIRIFVVTNGLAQKHEFKPIDYDGIEVTFEVVDFQRYFRHHDKGNSRQELKVKFDPPLPCISLNKEKYQYAMTVLPGKVLDNIYERWGARVLESNIRSFLSFKHKSVNSGIKKTLEEAPEMFVAYNNGAVIVADSVTFEQQSNGQFIRELSGIQIVNGGQTTASLYFAKRQNKSIDLDKVFVQAKIIIPTISNDSAHTEERQKFIAKIAEYSNRQTAVKASQLASNGKFHLAMEQLALRQYLPDGYGQWFYERATGSYDVWLRKNGTTPAKRKNLKDKIPSSRKLSVTDLAKYVMCWLEHPHIAATGSQKNFAFFNRIIESGEVELLTDLNQEKFKKMIAMVIIFKKLNSSLRKNKDLFKAFQANITEYTIAILSKHRKNNIDWASVWNYQEDGPTPGFSKALMKLALRVQDKLYETAQGRMISEWSKKEECWDELQKAEDWEEFCLKTFGTSTNLN